MKAIMYHYVQPFRKDLPKLRNLNFKSFIQQLDYFNKEQGFISRDDFIGCIENGLAEPGYVLTFDDGLKSHFDFVYPELKKRNLWGFFFVPGRIYLEEDFLEVHKIHILLAGNPSEEIRRILLKRINSDMIPDERVEDFRRMTYRNQVNDDATLEVKRILNYFISYQYRREIIDTLIKKFISPKLMDVWKYYVNPDELRRMASGGMLIGSHTVNHPVLSKLNLEDQHREITEAHQIIDDICGEQELKSFCFPYGGFHSFNGDTMKVLEKENFDLAFNVEARDINPEDIRFGKQKLPRYDCNLFPHGKS